MPRQEKVAMVMLHPGTPRDEQAREQLAERLPEHWKSRSGRPGG